MNSLSTLIHRLKKQRDDDERIHVLLRTKVAALAQRSGEQQAPPSQDEIDQVERLSRIIALNDATRSRTVQRAMTAGLALFLFGLAFALTVKHRGETDVILKMSASQLGFRLTAPGPLTESVGTSSLQATGIQGIDLVGPDEKSLAFLPSSQLRIASSDSSRVGLESLQAGAADKVIVEYVPSRPFEFRIQIEDTSTIAKASMIGSLRVETTRESKSLSFPSPRATTLLRNSKFLDLTLLLPDTSNDFFHSPLRVSELDVSRLTDLGDSVPDTVSTLSSAHLAFPELNTSREIHPSEVLRLKILRDGTLREVSLQPDHIVADFVGRVQDVTIGGKTAMPTWFEWASAQHAATLLWGAVTSVLVTLLAIWGWWRRPT
jgi:hypothetical protein